MSSLTKEFFIPHEQEGQYLTLPFEMPEGTDSFTLTYAYERYIPEPIQVNSGTFTARRKSNTIDLGLLAPDGSQVGASGSDKLSFTISEDHATPGYTPRPLTPGTWQILAGAYKVAEEGVNVRYELEFTPKKAFSFLENVFQKEEQAHQPAQPQPEGLQLFLGDAHTHTIASDGILTAEALASHAKSHGLDFLAITDHNQFAKTTALPHVEGITLIPGVEWTHYLGHATFLGVDQPYDEPFFTNDEHEMQARFVSAHARGALIALAHPFDESCPFKLAMGSLPHDCLEVWNGPMRESNLRAIGFWLQLLGTGKKIAITGGSDYHRDNLFQILGGPCMGVYAPSRSASDILMAMRMGHSFITFAPNGPTLHMTCGTAVMGDSLDFTEGLSLHIHADGLKAGDVLRIYSKGAPQDLLTAPADGTCDLDLPVMKPGFLVVQILRTFLPGIPPLPALLSNAIYFDRQEQLPQAKFELE